MKKALYVWNWVGGGYNQAYARSKVQALEEARKIWSVGKVDIKTLKRLNDKEADSYWRNFSLMN